MKELTYYEYIIKNFYRQHKVGFICLSILFFIFVYYFLGIDHFVLNHTKKFSIFDCIYMSIVTQTLLGPGDMLPITRTSRFFVMIQAFITLSISLLLIG